MKTNTKVKEPVRNYTGGGAIASNINAELRLRRAVLTSFLWEGTAYASGVDGVDNLATLIPQVDPAIVADIAREARSKQYLRHVPLAIVREMVKHDSHRPLVADTLGDVVQRADELAEFLALYWKDGKVPIAMSVRKGLTKALRKFDEFQLSRYAGEGKTVKLKDVIKMIRPTPTTKLQSKLWKAVIEGSLKTADTWESEMSENGNTKEGWTRLLKENKLGGLALLRNLRNIIAKDVDENLIEQALATNPFKYVLPFRFMKAAEHAPRFQRDIEKAMLRQLGDQEKLAGRTVIAVDLSGSMNTTMSGFSENTRADIAISLAVIFREICEECVIYVTAGSDGSGKGRHALVVNPKHGLELAKQIKGYQDEVGGGGIFLRQLTEYLAPREDADRFVVISDSQDCDHDHNRRGPAASTPFASKHNYVLDISCEKNGIGYEKFVVINGFSEKVVDFIKLYEDLVARADATPSKPKAVKKAVRRLNLN